VWRKKQDISRAFLTNYEKLFSSQGPTRVTEYLLHMEPITVEMNVTFLQPFVEE
jgi:hypothetical protein